MANAKNVNLKELGHNILLLGYTGSGKTAQILTLPGKTFCYLFDPSALHTLAGHDVEYEMFVASQLNLAAQSLSKGQSDQRSKKVDQHEIYYDFAKDLEERVEKEWFKENGINNVVLDSFTTFSDAVMDRVMHLNGRVGQNPQQDDYAAQMVTIKSVVRELVGQDVRIVCTGHVTFEKDEESGKMLNIIRLTGQLRTTIPLLFSDILVCDVERVGDQSKYVILTQKDRFNPQIRCTIRDKAGKTLNPKIDVTIPNELWDDPRGKAGLGKLLSEIK